MKKLPNFVKWLIIAVVLAAMAAMMVAVNDRASRVEMPMPDNSLGIYRQTPPLESESEKRNGTAGKQSRFCMMPPPPAYAVRTNLNGWEARVCLWSH